MFACHRVIDGKAEALYSTPLPHRVEILEFIFDYKFLILRLL